MPVPYGALWCEGDGAYRLWLESGVQAVGIYGILQPILDKLYSGGKSRDLSYRPAIYKLS